jgi:hypothetical protein
MSMRTLSAIALICLSIPAFANEPCFGDLPQDPTIHSFNAEADFNFDDENTASITPAMPMSEGQSVKGIEAGNPYARADFDFGFEDTGRISPSVPAKTEDYSLDFGLIADEALAYTRDDVDLYEIGAPTRSKQSNLAFNKPELHTTSGGSHPIEAAPMGGLDCDECDVKRLAAPVQTPLR